MRDGLVRHDDDNEEKEEEEELEEEGKMEIHERAQVEGRKGRRK